MPNQNNKKNKRRPRRRRQPRSGSGPLPAVKPNVIVPVPRQFIDGPYCERLSTIHTLNTTTTLSSFVLLMWCRQASFQGASAQTLTFDTDTFGSTSQNPQYAWLNRGWSNVMPLKCVITYTPFETVHDRSESVAQYQTLEIATIADEVQFSSPTIGYPMEQSNDYQLHVLNGNRSYRKTLNISAYLRQQKQGYSPTESASSASTGYPNEMLYMLTMLRIDSVNRSLAAGNTLGRLQVDWYLQFNIRKRQ